MLAAQMTASHRVSMSGLESVGNWADGLRLRSDLSIASVDKQTELIGRLGNTVTRLMTTVQRAIAMMDRAEDAAERRIARRQMPDA